MQVDEKALEAAYDAGRDYVMDMDDRTKQMIRVCVRAYLSALGEQKPVAWQGRDHQDDRWNFLRKCPGVGAWAETRPLYASPLPVRPITDEDVERAAKAILREMETNRSAFPDTRDLARAALEAAGGRR